MGHNNSFNLRFSVSVNDGSSVSSYRSYLLTCKQTVDVQTMMNRLSEKIHAAMIELDVELNLEEEKEGKQVNSPAEWADIIRENPS